MSLSPARSPPPLPPPTIPPSPAAPPASVVDSPVQLASLLTAALRDVDALRHDLAAVKRRADKAERLLAYFTQATNLVNPTASPPAPAAPSPAPPPLAEATVRSILDFDARLERAEFARDEADTRLRVLADTWSDAEQYIQDYDDRRRDLLKHFSRIIAHHSGRLVARPHSPNPPHFGPSHGATPDARHPTRSIAALPYRPALSSQLPSLPLPPHPNPHPSRVRPRANSLETPQYLTGPGAPPPAKKFRPDTRGRELVDRYDRSPIASPRSLPATNGQLERSPLAPGHPSAQSLHPYYSSQPLRQSANRSRGGDSIQIQYVDTAQPRYALHRRGRSISRSRSRSRGSSMSIDELLLEATTGEDATRAQQGQGTPLIHHPSQHLPHPLAQAHRPRHRSPASDREDDYHVRRAPSQLHPSAAASGVGVSPPGAGQAAISQVQTYQTHIFAPPVTGAPVKKPKLTNTPSTSSVGGNGSVLTLGPSGSVISGPSTLGAGGFPPTNAQGQRICRQCGLPGRYKDGKCVEKWGPGPEGPGTVCDRCRKKMKRVERRGTLDLANQASHASAHHLGPPPSTGHPSRSPNLDGRGSQHMSQHGNTLHRAETMPNPHSAAQSGRGTLGPERTQLLPQSSRPGSPHGGSYAGRRAPPTPPYIATLPGSSVHDMDEYDSERMGRPKGSRAPSPHGSKQPPSLNGLARTTNGMRSGATSVSPPHPSIAAMNGSAVRGSPRVGGSSPKDGSASGDGDADGEADADAEVEADADGDADAEAELLEAVDAAEANNAGSDEEWAKKEEM